MSGNFREDNALFIFVMWFWKGKPCDATDYSAVRKGVSKEVGAGGSFDIFLDSVQSTHGQSIVICSWK